MAIETVGDYIKKDCSEDILFKSEVVVRGGGADVYRICDKHSSTDEYLHIEPINGRSSDLKTIHVPLNQHLEDKVLDDEIIKGVVLEAIERYNACTTTLEPFDNWIGSLKGVEYYLARKIRDYVREKNQKPSTFMPGINNSHTKEILSLFNIRHQ